MSIGALSALTDCSVPTIRYYEQIDLLPTARRGQNGHRYYGDADVTRLAFIKRCRDFGFTIEQVRSLVALMVDGDRACAELREVAEGHLHVVQRRLSELRQLEQSLTAVVAQCVSVCADGKARDCSIIGDLNAAAPPAGGGCCAPAQQRRGAR